MDREKAKRHAVEQAHHLANERYGHGSNGTEYLRNNGGYEPGYNAGYGGGYGGPPQQGYSGGPGYGGPQQGYGGGPPQGYGGGGGGYGGDQGA
jgi:hypothetical protein